MKEISWRAPLLAVATAFVAFVVVGCGAKEEAAETAAVQGDPVAVASTEAPADESAWLTSVEEGLAKAKVEGKMVLVDFGAEW